MNNKLDATETESWTENEKTQKDKEVITTDLDAPDVIIESAGSPATQSGDSVSQSLLKDAEQDEDSNEENTQSSSSNSDFEIVNENAVKVWKFPVAGDWRKSHVARNSLTFGRISDTV